MPFNIGVQELLIILIIVVVFVGVSRVPDIGEVLGKAVSEFQQIKKEIEKEVKGVTGNMPLRLDKLLNIVKMITGRK